jgi:curved DNA-binding protein CbpA
MRAGAPSLNAGARPSRRRFGACALVIGLGVMAPAAHAERPVYRNLDDTGGVVYSDRALGPGSARVKIWKSANPSRAQYDAAVLRAESDRLYYERLRAEDLVPRTASAEALKAAYATRLSALGERTTAEAHAERTILREAYEALSDPERRKLYDDRLREDALQALSSGGEQVRARPASARLIEAEPVGESSSPFGWMIGIAAVLLVGVGAGWVYLDHQRKTEELRLAKERQAEMARQREAAVQRFDNTMDWAKQRMDKDRETAAYQRQEAQRQRERQQWQYEQDRIARQNAAEAASAAICSSSSATVA